MQSKIVSIGNSKGVRIPKALLKSAKLSDNIIMYVVDDELRIKNAPDPDVNEESLLSEKALADWLRPEEDEAWKDL